MIARSFAHSSPGCEPIGVILTFCASAGNAASKRANAAQAIFMSFLLRSVFTIPIYPEDETKLFFLSRHIGRQNAVCVQEFARRQRSTTPGILPRLGLRIVWGVA